MKKIGIYFVILNGIFALASLAAAQDAALIQAARKEGKVVWYTSLAIPSSTAIAHIFKTNIKASRWKCTARARRGCCNDSCRKPLRE